MKGMVLRGVNEGGLMWEEMVEWDWSDDDVSFLMAPRNWRKLYWINVRYIMIYDDGLDTLQKTAVGCLDIVSRGSIS